MNRNQVKGIIDEVAGTAKRKAGELTDNPKLKVEGMIQQAKGRVEGAWGKTKGAAHDAVKNTEVHLNTHATLKTKSSTADAQCKKCK
jgi:uncharacterized protein YjbJ (UPF0337 family)